MENVIKQKKKAAFFIEKENGSDVVTNESENVLVQLIVNRLLHQ